MDTLQPLIARQQQAYCCLAATRRALGWLLLAALFATFIAVLDGKLDSSDVDFLVWLLQPLLLLCIGFVVVASLTYNFGERLELRLDPRQLQVLRHGELTIFSINSLYHVKLRGNYPMRLTLFCGASGRAVRYELHGVKPQTVRMLVDRLAEQVRWQAPLKPKGRFPQLLGSVRSHSL